MTRTFGGGNPNPFAAYVDANGNAIFKGTFEEHHVIPREIFNDSSGKYTDQKNFLSKIGFNGEDFDRNGLFIPGNEHDAALLGSGMHRGPHPKMTEFVGKRIAEIEAKYDNDIERFTAENRAISSPMW